MKLEVLVRVTGGSRKDDWFKSTLIERSPLQISTDKSSLATFLFSFYLKGLMSCVTFRSYNYIFLIKIYTFSGLNSIF